MAAFRSLRSRKRLHQSLDLCGGCEHLAGLGANTNVFRKIFPPNGAGGIHEKFGGAGYILPFRAAAMVDQVIAADYVEFGVREKREGVSGFIAQSGRFFRRINADGNGLHAGSLKFLEIFLDAS